MACTVKQLAEISGVSIRTLHYYDEIGLLEPAYVGEQGYRFYEEVQLLTLQQILFFRELGFELKEIQNILCQTDFDRLKALESHKDLLRQKGERMHELIKTIDKTINRIKGHNKMTDKEMYQGFTPEKQAEHESYLVNRHGNVAQTWIEDSKRNTKNWSKEQWNASHQAWDGICKDLADLLSAQTPAGSPQAQAVVKRHYELISQFWTPNHEAYVGLGQGYLGQEWKQAFERFDEHHPKLATYLADGIKVFAKREFPLK